MLNISKEKQETILSSIELNHIESFDNGRGPEVYSTTINIDVTIDGSTYSVTHQRGTDGQVDLAPFDYSGLPDMYEALVKLAGEYKEGMCDYYDDIYEMFIGRNSEGLISDELYLFAGDICDKIARVAQLEQNEFDSERKGGFEVTVEKDNRIEYRFIGHNDVCYGRGSNRVEACDDARATLGEPMSTDEEFDENGYLVAVEQEWTGVEWADVEVVAV